MKKYVFLIATLMLVLACYYMFVKEKRVQDEITIACYYFPNYHIRDKQDLRISNQHWDNWSEWELVKNAKPRFEGHCQPNVPAWGYTDEKDPKVMEQKIETASEYGIDVFIFDWYNYEGKPFLNRCLDKGFLKAANSQKINFALMWANHDWQDLFPYTLGATPEYLYSGRVTLEEFDKIADDLVGRYFIRDNYWKIDGKAYFSIYDIQNFINGFGSLEKTKQAMDLLRDKAKRAGLKGVHWNLIAWGMPILPGQDKPKDIPSLISELNFDSTTSYVWIHHACLDEPQTDYNHVRDQYFSYWEKADSTYGVPYFPNLTMGWDPTPRTNQNLPWKGGQGYPYTNIIVNNTPENFEEALRQIKKRVLNSTNVPRVITVNCWNEWTEGSYLEPDTIHGLDYLKAIDNVMKSK